jgi:hypothetical protein
VTACGVSTTFAEASPASLDEHATTIVATVTAHPIVIHFIVGFLCFLNERPINRTGP